MNATISQKRDVQGAGHQSTKDGSGSEGNGGGDCGGKGDGGGVCCDEGRDNGGSGDVEDDDNNNNDGDDGCRVVGGGCGDGDLGGESRQHVGDMSP